MLKNWGKKTQNSENWNKGIVCILTSYIENLIC